MPEQRHKGKNWAVSQPDCNPDFDGAKLAVLMDIRDELQRLNALLHCENFIGIPRTLRTISRKIPARRPRRRQG